MDKYAQKHVVKLDDLPYLNCAAVGGAISSCPGKEREEEKINCKASAFCDLISAEGKSQHKCQAVLKWQSLSVTTLWIQREEASRGEKGGENL